MSQCVPSLDADDNPTAPGISLPFHSSFTAPDVPKSDYEVAELTWENGQISMHGIGLPQVPAKRATATATTNSRATDATPSTKDTWEKPRGGTLESIVNQATGLPHRSKALFEAGSGGESNGPELVPWFDPHRADEVAAAAVVSNTMTMDALVPCSNRTDRHSKQVMDSVPPLGTCMVGCSKRVGSCSGAATEEDDAVLAVKHARAARVPVGQEWDGRDRSVSSSATIGRGSQHVTLDTYDKELSMGFTSTGSPENTSSSKHCTKTTTADDHDSVGHSGPLSEAGDAEDKKEGIGKSSVSTKRSRAADMHNQSERKRRDKINQRMKTLQKLVPNSSKTDKASMLDEVIDYIKQLQAQVQMINRMNMSPMMLPMALQQQLQMSMMAPMGMGLGMGMGMGMGMGLGMDMNAMNRAAANISGMPPVLSPAAFMPMARWDAFGGDRMQGAPATVVPDLFSTFLACQQQPMAIDAYSRMVAMYQQLQQHSASNSKS